MRHPWFCLFFAGLFSSLVSAGAVSAAEQGDDSQRGGEGKAVKREELPPARTHYKGREIAKPMHHSAAEWLTRAERARQENTALLMEQLDIEEGQTVADIGCGNGYFTLRMARRVGSKGTVFAVDIQEEMLRKLAKRAEEAEPKLENIRLIHGTVAAPKLPENSCDLILLVDAYHEFSHPVHMLRDMRKALKPDGRLALVEFRAEDPDVPIKPLHKMSKRQIMKELPPNGLELVESFDELPWQHLMFFERAPLPEDAEDPAKRSDR
jgi:ubiquinone/menaquinone biosynthesis C-methylase UbiE